MISWCALACDRPARQSSLPTETPTRKASAALAGEASTMMLNTAADALLYCDFLFQKVF